MPAKVFVGTFFWCVSVGIIILVTGMIKFDYYFVLSCVSCYCVAKLDKRVVPVLRVFLFCYSSNDRVGAEL